MEKDSFKTLGVKVWFADKNKMVNYAIDSIIEERDKAVRIAMSYRGKTFFYWCPKSCLEFRTEYNKYQYSNLDNIDNIQEAITICKMTCSIDELIKSNEDIYDLYD